MKKSMRDLPITVEEIRDLMKKEEAKRCGIIMAAVGVVAVLVGVILWVARKREKDLEEHYEYFDDDFDELDENYDEFDDSIYDDDNDDDEKIEYVKIKDFMNDEEAAGEAAQESEESAQSEEQAETEEQTE